MEKMVDSGAAMMAARKHMRDGPYFTGNTPAKGVTFREDERETRSTVKRFTDRYVRFRTVGITAEEYPEPCMLPLELKQFIGITDGSAKAPAGPAKRRQLDVSELNMVEQQDDEQKPATAKDDEKADGDEEVSGPEELEDEFEEFEDDDYNAEKYFDDGDDDGLGNDDDGEAAY